MGPSQIAHMADYRVPDSPYGRIQGQIEPYSRIQGQIEPYGQVEGLVGLYGHVGPCIW